MTKKVTKKKAKKKAKKLPTFDEFIGRPVNDIMADIELRLEIREGNYGTHEIAITSDDLWEKRGSYWYDSDRTAIRLFAEADIAWPEGGAFVTVDSSCEEWLRERLLDAADAVMMNEGMLEQTRDALRNAVGIIHRRREEKAREDQERRNRIAKNQIERAGDGAEDATVVAIGDHKTDYSYGDTRRYTVYDVMVKDADGNWHDDPKRETQADVKDAYPDAGKIVLRSPSGNPRLFDRTKTKPKAKTKAELQAEVEALRKQLEAQA